MQQNLTEMQEQDTLLSFRQCKIHCITSSGLSFTLSTHVSEIFDLLSSLQGWESQQRNTGSGFCLVYISWRKITYWLLVLISLQNTFSHCTCSVTKVSGNKGYLMKEHFLVSWAGPYVCQRVSKQKATRYYKHSPKNSMKQRSSKYLICYVLFFYDARDLGGNPMFMYHHPQLWI